MKVKAGTIDLEVEIDTVSVAGDSINLGGFAGIQEVETTIHGRELIKLAGHFFRPSVIWLCIRSLFMTGSS